ncbi:MAG TPA: tetratricopeptide repeat protein [Candidatus Pelagibacter sp.]|nr:tetratricopeptide repeat protein [Candidatus Pelagibacter sp.]
MRLNLLKIFFIIVTLLYQSTAYSKATDNNEFNHKYLSSYLSALLSYDNQNNDLALKYFNSSKNLLNEHDQFLKKYVFSLVADGQISKAIKYIQYSKNKNNSSFFEVKLLLVLDSLNKKNFVKTSKLLTNLKAFQQNDTYEFIIYETLKSYNKLFLDGIIESPNQNFGKISLITTAFQNCYLNSNKTNSHFINLINSAEGDYSRYLFFYLTKLIENKDYDSAIQIASTIDPLTSDLLIAQTKKWIDQSNFKKFKKHFSCKQEADILAEFFFLISNLYSSQGEYEKSNFFLNISNYLNPKFYFNLSLLAENYFVNSNFDLAKKVLEKFDEEDEIYNWYKIKKKAQIIAKQKNKNQSLKFVEKKLLEFKNPSTRIIFDMANMYKNYKKYEKAIEYYSIVLSQIEENSEAYADILYRRGGSYERLGQYQKSDSDLLLSLEIIPEDPYVINYLAYSWLERNYKIQEAIQMLERAYEQKKSDPYIIDSIGWGYYLNGDYAKAEKYLKQAIQLMPNDPIVNDHYGDILWKLDRKLQARYFWESVLNFKTTEDDMKKNILKKLLKGPKET